LGRGFLKQQWNHGDGHEKGTTTQQ
jgi:hypothetical protein